jgi:hypothetical protein
MKKISLIIISSIALVFTSCLKDKNIDEQKYGLKGLGDIPLVLFPVKKTTTTLNASDKDTSFHLVTVRLAAGEVASEDVQVTLVPNNAAVTAAGFTPAPTSAYKVDNLVVTIPKGEREGYLTITTKTSNLAAATYGFGYDIASVSNPKYTISATGKTTVTVLPIKNKYDGVYNLKIATTGWAAFGIMDDPALKAYPGTFSLITTGANTVTTSNASAGTLQPGLTSTGGATAFGATTPQFTFDLATNNVTAVTNTTPDDGRGRVLQIRAVPGNKYDPATKTITAHYIMKQNGRPDMNIDVEFTYVKPR